MTSSFEPRPSIALRWSLGFLAGLGIHAGAIGAALVTLAQPEDIDEVAGPVAIELAPMPVAPPAERSDAPLGPRAQETPAAPPLPTKTEVAKAEEAPPLPTTPYEPDDPELRMAKPNPKTDETFDAKDDTTKERIEQAAAVPSASVPETTAPPPSNAPPAEAVAAPQAGLSESDKQIIANWQRKVVVHLDRFKRYPQEARQRGARGDVRVSFRIDRSGLIVSREISGASGSSTLDQAALDLLVRASPVPQPPPQLAGVEFELTLPIQYRMKD